MLVLALVSLILKVQCVCTFTSAFIELKPIKCIKRVFSAKKRVLAHLTSFLLKNPFKRREMLVLRPVSLISKVRCVCTFPSAFIALKPITCIKSVYSANYRFLEHLTSFLLKNLIKRREMLVLALVNLILQNLKRFHVSQCFHCVKTDDVNKTRF